MKYDHFKITLLFAAAFLYINTESFAQSPKADKNKDKVTIEDIKPICTDLPKEKKPRVTVANFKLTAPNAPRDQFGENLATMLTNALQKVQCFRVLER
ncbi:MAG: CsgG/HfaB family protein, partial [Parafilimonas sp.]